MRRTSQHRNTEELMAYYERASRDVEESPEVERIWKAYVRLNPYAAGETVASAMESVREIGRRIAP